MAKAKVSSTSNKRRNSESSAGVKLPSQERGTRGGDAPPPENYEPTSPTSSDLVAAPGSVDLMVLLTVLAHVKEGDFTARVPLDWTGVAGRVAESLNDVIVANQALEAELGRISQVGRIRVRQSTTARATRTTSSAAPRRSPCPTPRPGRPRPTRRTSARRSSPAAASATGS